MQATHQHLDFQEVLYLRCGFVDAKGMPLAGRANMADPLRVSVLAHKIAACPSCKKAARRISNEAASSRPTVANARHPQVARLAVAASLLCIPAMILATAHYQGYKSVWKGWLPIRQGELVTGGDDSGAQVHMSHGLTPSARIEVHRDAELRLSEQQNDGKWRWRVVRGSAEVFAQRRLEPVELELGQARLHVLADADQEAHVVVESSPQDLANGKKHLARVRVIQGRLLCCQSNSHSVRARRGDVMHIDSQMARAVAFPAGPVANR